MKIYHCPHCDSTNVYHDALVNMNHLDDVEILDDASCSDCGWGGGSYKAIEKESNEPTTQS